jgi:hypothetical protein
MRIVYDARGAFYKEIEEYGAFDVPAIVSQARILEEQALSISHSRIAVSAALVDYWKNEFNHTSGRDFVIPCTLQSASGIQEFDKDKIEIYRAEFGFKPDEIVFLFSGSTAGWQSFSLMDTFCCQVLESNPVARFIILARGIPDNLVMMQKHSNRVSIKWVEPSEVHNISIMADYGILLREESITNKVSSPTKFAEYLIAGLPVIISPEVGDYSKFVSEHNCGFIYTGFVPEFQRTTETQRLRIHHLATMYFYKNCHDETYRKLLSV